MHRVLVEKKRWISEERFLHALNYCMLLPGPEAMQLATYVGWLLHRTLGGLTAGILFVIPGFFSILALGYLYAGFQDVKIIQALFFGLKPAVLAIVIEAVLRIGRRALKNRFMIAISAAAFVAIFFLNVPFPVIILFAALIGLVGGHLRPDLFPTGGHVPKDQDNKAVPFVDAFIDGYRPDQARPSFRRSLRVGSVWLLLWFGPVAALAFFLGGTHVFVQQAVFFSKAAVVTFGGAYSVLSYVAQQAVEKFSWLRPGEMLDGLGMAETTPGPLIQVVQFVGFMGAFRDPGSLHPMLAATVASVIVTWVTYVPCFLWIFLGAPYVEAVRGYRMLSAGLSAITTSVVGVVLNLAIWFSLHTLFASVEEVRWMGMRLLAPEWTTVRVPSLVLAVGAIVAMLRYRVGMLTTLACSAALGAAYHLAIEK